MKEYRCTFPDLYGEGTVGHKDPSARQGHYTSANTPTGAARVVRRRQDILTRRTGPVDVQAWDDSKGALGEPVRVEVV